MDAVEAPNPGQVFKWVHNSIGTNGRLTEFQAAIGRRQLLKLDKWVEQRNRNARVLANNLHAIDGIRIPVLARLNPLSSGRACHHFGQRVGDSSHMRFIHGRMNREHQTSFTQVPGYWQPILGSR